jgi:hypothetical protein
MTERCAVSESLNSQEFEDRWGDEKPENLISIVVTLAHPETDAVMALPAIEMNRQTWINMDEAARGEFCEEQRYELTKCNYIEV